MDHPKLDLGLLKYPKEEILKMISLKTKINSISYYGISLKKNIQLKHSLLNTYVRFEKINNKIKNFINFIKNKDIKNIYSIRCFFEMMPNFKNQITFKKNKPNIKLQISKTEIETLKLLTKKIYYFFSEKPKLENIKIYNQKNLKLNDASHHMGGLIYPKLVDKNLKLNGLKKFLYVRLPYFPHLVVPTQH